LLSISQISLTNTGGASYVFSGTWEHVVGTRMFFGDTKGDYAHSESCTTASKKISFVRVHLEPKAQEPAQNLVLAESTAMASAGTAMALAGAGGALGKTTRKR